VALPESLKIDNLREALFYGHGSTFTSIEDVVKYKNEAIKANPNVPDSQLSEHFKPLGLSHEEIQLLTEFLYTALHDDNLRRYVPSELPSGFCFPNNDIESRTDLGCN
jgi:cytochrome c peroxidase